MLTLERQSIVHCPKMGNAIYSFAGLCYLFCPYDTNAITATSLLNYAYSLMIQPLTTKYNESL